MEEQGLSSRAGAEFPDIGLSRQFGGMRALRLFVLTLFVPPNVRRNSLLIGVRKPEDMVRVREAIHKRPEIPCSELRAQDVACASFGGVVSASVEMGVGERAPRVSAHRIDGGDGTRGRSSG
jgi:hypothetical protein